MQGKTAQGIWTKIACMCIIAEPSVLAILFTEISYCLKFTCFHSDVGSACGSFISALVQLDIYNTFTGYTVCRVAAVTTSCNQLKQV